MSRFFTAGAGGLSFYGVTPVRLLDSSKNLGLTGPFKSRTARLSRSGYLYHPLDCGGHRRQPDPDQSVRQRLGPYIPRHRGQPHTSTVNASLGHSEANGFDVALGASGKVALEWPALPAPAPTSPSTSPATGSRGREGRSGGWTQALPGRTLTMRPHKRVCPRDRWSCEP